MEANSEDSNAESLESFDAQSAIDAARARRDSGHVDDVGQSLLPDQAGHASGGAAPHRPGLSERLGMFVAPALRSEPESDTGSAPEDFRSRVSRETERGSGSLAKRLIGEEEEDVPPTTEYRGNPFMSKLAEQRRRKLGASGRRD